MERIATASPAGLARFAGGLYLLNIIGGAFAIGFVPAALVVAGNAGATAHNIQANELLYRSGIVANILVDVTAVFMAVIFYDLFKVVNRRLALLVVFFTLVGTAVESANLLTLVVPLILLNGGQYASAFTTQQLHALAYMTTSLGQAGYDINSVFFGFYGLTIGYLVFRSTFMPRVIGVLLAVGASSYMAYSFADLLAPAFASHLVPWIQLLSLPGEGSLCLWFLAAGVDIEHWQQRASSAASRLQWAQ